MNYIYLAIMLCVSLSYVYINELRMPGHNALRFIELCIY